MDSILSMPSSCFEQTSSSAYPNVLALDYMKHTKKLTPEVHAKVKSYISNGYNLKEHDPTPSVMLTDTSPEAHSLYLMLGEIDKEGPRTSLCRS
jgi:A-macroglobulin TED domain